MDILDTKGFQNLICAHISDSCFTFIESIGKAIALGIAEEKSSVWITLITDLITIAAALGALALPISINVIETTRSRYKSPSLLKLSDTLSGVNIKNLNAQIFIIIIICLIFKMIVTTRLISLNDIAPWLCVITFWFAGVVIKVFRHLKYTYIIMSDVTIIQDHIFSKIKKFSEQEIFVLKDNESSYWKEFYYIRDYNGNNPIKDYISGFLELETYLICNDSSKTEIDSRFKKISYMAVESLDNTAANDFIKYILDSLPAALAALEVSREVDIYQSATGFYLHIAMSAILAKEDFFNHLGVIERIARFREDKIPAYGRFCRNGRIFLSFAHNRKSSEERYGLLIKHFQLLINNSLLDQVENIPNLLINVREIIQFKGMYNKGAWQLAQEVEELWGADLLVNLDFDMGDAWAGKITISELTNKFTNYYKPLIVERILSQVPNKDLAEEKSIKIDEVFLAAVKDIELQNFSSEIETETLRAMAVLISSSPEIFIECREIRNPAGSRAFNVGHSPVPTSLSECVQAFVSPKNFEVFPRNFNELQEYKIIDAIGALITYELWSVFVLGKKEITIKSEITIPSLPEYQIGDLSSAIKRITFLEASLDKCQANERFIARLGILPDQKILLSALAHEFIDKLRESLISTEKLKIATQVIDLNAVDKFKSELVDDLSSAIGKYLLFDNVIVNKVKPINSNIAIERKAFLSGTNIHYMLNGHGSNLAREVHYLLSRNILLSHPNTIDSRSALPIFNAEWIICSSRALDKFKASGFETSAGMLTWPGGIGSLRYYKINCDSDGYFTVMPGDNLIYADYSKKTKGLPLEINYQDNGENLVFSIDIYVSENI